MYGMHDIENPMDLKDIKALHTYMKTTKFNALSANALCILWVAFSETCPGTTCLQVSDDSGLLPIFVDWLKTGMDDPY